MAYHYNHNFAVAQSVFALIQSRLADHPNNFSVNPFRNGREQGLQVFDNQSFKSISFCESRNSDQIVVYYGHIMDHFNSDGWLTEEAYASSDHKKYFKYNETWECAAFILQFLFNE